MQHEKNKEHLGLSSSEEYEIFIDIKKDKELFKIFLVFVNKEISYWKELRDKFDLDDKTIKDKIKYLDKINFVEYMESSDLNIIQFDTLKRLDNLYHNKVNLYKITPLARGFYIKYEKAFDEEINKQNLDYYTNRVNKVSQDIMKAQKDICHDESMAFRRSHYNSDGILYQTQTMKDKILKNKVLKSISDLRASNTFKNSEFVKESLNDLKLSKELIKRKNIKKELENLRLLDSQKYLIKIKEMQKEQMLKADKKMREFQEAQREINISKSNLELKESHLVDLEVEKRGEQLLQDLDLNNN